MRSGDCFVNGTWRPGRGESFSARHPATQAVHWTGNAANADDVAGAVTAARAGFSVWSRMPLSERIGIVRRFGALAKERAGDLAAAIVMDAAKPEWEAKTEAAAIAAKVEISITAHQERTGKVERPGPSERTVIRHKPHGVCAVFGPYNFPGHLANGHIVPALIAGNAVILKPSELTPGTSEVMTLLWQESGLPDGVFNLLQGGRETGMALAAADLDGLFFTGSEQTGLSLHRAAAGNLRRILALELGGNNPLVVWPDVDAKAAALETVLSAYITAGQRCTCARRLIVPDDSFGRDILDEIARLIPRLSVGRPDENPFMGPLISNEAADAVMRAQEQLIARGAAALVAATRPDPALPFVTPGLIDVTGCTARRDEELFGPVLQVIRVADFEAAIDEANATRFGLAAGLFSDDPALWSRFETGIRAGIVNWNRQTTGASSAAPFGGVGNSGNHRPAAWYAADYCAWPSASIERERLTLPETLLPGIRP